MKQFGILAVLVMLLGSCSVYKEAFDLTEEKPAKGRMIVPFRSDTLAYQDSLVAIWLWPTNKAVKFRLENRTAQMLKIVWDDCAFSKNGEPDAVTHQGVKYLEASKTKLPTIVPPFGVVNDRFIPVGGLEFMDAGALSKRFGFDKA